MDINTLQQRLQSNENKLIDFKECHYFAENGAEIDNNKPKTIDFIKDILSMANTPREESAYIVVGIANDKTIKGVSYQIESRYLHNKFNSKCNIDIKFTVYPLQYEGKDLCIIEIPVVKYPYPCVLKQELKPKFAEPNRVYYRKDDNNTEADQAMIKEINSWLDKLPTGLTALPNLEPYTKQVTKDYQDLKNFFVYLSGIEVQNVSIIAQEINSSTRRRGTIEELCLQVATKERRMIITGEPGMGKTTALKFLTHKITQSFAYNEKPTPQKPLPLYLELRSAKSEVFDLITERLERYFVTLNKDNIKKIAEKMLQQGAFILFFDGLNEIVKDSKKKIQTQLSGFEAKYPNCMFVITTRPSDSENRQVLHKIPTFELLPMDEEQQKEFLGKNCTDDNTKLLLQNAIPEYPQLNEFMGIPLWFLMIIKVVQKEKRVPPTHTHIAKAFLNGLYQFEENKKDNFDAQIAEKIMPHIAYDITQLESNSKISIAQLMQSITTKAQALSLTLADPKEFVDTICELKIMERSDTEIWFKHQWFLDYLSSEATDFIW